jgi:Mg2+ and Co2+ transporter CorA
LAMNLREIAGMQWNTLTWMSVIAIPVLIALCGYLSRRTSCRIEETETNLEKEQ